MSVDLRTRIRYWKYNYTGTINNLVLEPVLLQDYRIGKFNDLKGGANINNVKYAGCCKKYITFSEDDRGELIIDNHCIDFAKIYFLLRPSLYKDISNNKRTSHAMDREFNYAAQTVFDTMRSDVESDAELKIAYEEVIGLNVGLAIWRNGGERMNFMCFSDVHGDLAALMTAIKIADLCLGKNKYVFSLGDSINQKLDYWDDRRAELFYTGRVNQWKPDTEYKLRDLYIEAIERHFLELKNTSYICIHGNHDGEFLSYRPSRAVIINPRYQLLFQHAIMNKNMLEHMEETPRKVKEVGRSKILLYYCEEIAEYRSERERDDETYNLLTGDYFLRAARDRNEIEKYVQEDIHFINDTMKAAVASPDNEVMNPFFCFGHDYKYFYLPLAVSKGATAVPTVREDTIRSILNDETNPLVSADMKFSRLKPIGVFGRIFCTDGNIPALHQKIQEGIPLSIEGGKNKHNTVSIIVIAIAWVVIISIICFTVMYVRTINSVEMLQSSKCRSHQS